MSALAMILTATMVIPATGPERVSGEVEQGLDFSGAWEGEWHPFDGGKGYAVIGRREWILRSEAAQQRMSAGQVRDEGRGKCNLLLAGVTYYGIYRQDGDHLLLCFCEDRHRRRPGSFVGGNGQDLFILHRINPRK